MDKKVILITGGSRGSAPSLSESSPRPKTGVYFTYSDASARFPSGGNTTPVLCNQKNAAEIIGCIAQITEEQGKIDALVNNACPAFSLRFP